MALIFEINGYKAVGKSTLIAGLKERFPNAIFREGFRKIKNQLDITEEEQFYENEKAYIIREIEEFRQLRDSNKIVILLRGPEEVGFFAKYAPKLKYGKDWDVEFHLKKELSELSKYKADYILWLDADKETLYKRKDNDQTKARNNMEKWNSVWNPYLGNYIKGLSYTETIDTTTLEKEAVLNWVVKWIYGKVKQKMRVQIPERIYIETTNACNAKCIMCPHPKMKREIQTMSDDTFNHIVDELSRLDLLNTTIFMHKEGEPLLDKEIFNRIKAVHGSTNCKEIAINTNASLLNKENAEKLVDSGINTIYLSVDGATKQTYESIRIGLNYDAVKKNIEYLFECIAKSNKKIKVIMQMLTYSKNEDEVETFKKIWSKYPCEIFIKKMHSYLDGGMSSLTPQLNDKQIHACTDPFNLLVIYSNGNYGNCCWDYENTFSLGNIANESIVEVFNSNKINMIRLKHSLFECKDLAPCNRCMRAFGNDSICGISGGKEINIK